VPGVELTQEDITQGDIELVEAVLRLDSSLKGQSLRQVDFRRRYGLSVLAIARASQVIVQGVSDVSLQGGDVLLIQGDRRHVGPVAGTLGFKRVTDRLLEVHDA